MKMGFGVVVASSSLKPFSSKKRGSGSNPAEKLSCRSGQSNGADLRSARETFRGFEPLTQYCCQGVDTRPDVVSTSCRVSAHPAPAPW